MLLWLTIWNCEETAAEPPLPPKPPFPAEFFLPFLAILPRQFSIIWNKLFFIQISLFPYNFAWIFYTCNLFYYWHVWNITSVIWKYKGNFYEQKSLSQMIEDCLIWREKATNRRFSAGAAVPPPFLHNSILYLFKATAMPNLRAVTLYLVEFLRLLVLVSKSITSAPPPFKFVNGDNFILINCECN